MILSDRDIVDRLAGQTLMVHPIDHHNQQIQPASVDLRLGNEFLLPNDLDDQTIDARDQEGCQNLQAHTVPDDEGFVLGANRFALATTIEWVAIPFDLVGRLEGRSSVARLGLIVHTAGWIDPGFRGRITLELRNLRTTPIRLWPGMRICQIAFHELSSQPDRPYGDARVSKYQGQHTVTASRIWQDLRHSD